MVIYTLYQSQIVTMQNSLPYTVRYVLGRPASATTLIFAGMLIGVIAATPLWLKYAKKVNDNKKVMLYSSILLGVFTLPLLFLTNYIAIIIAILIWGTALGGFWFMIFPVMLEESLQQSLGFYHCLLLNRRKSSKHPAPYRTF